MNRDFFPRNHQLCTKLHQRNELFQILVHQLLVLSKVRSEHDCNGTFPENWRQRHEGNLIHHLKKKTDMLKFNQFFKSFKFT
jgi:hypothetical protein